MRKREKILARPCRTKIICTIGPASKDERVLWLMAKAGMDVARLNFSHGTHQEHAQVIDKVRRINKKLSRPIKILQDLEGYRIRVGQLTTPLDLKKGRAYWISSRDRGGAQTIPLDAEIHMRALKTGMHVFMCDGYIDLEIIRVLKEKIKVKVIHGGVLSSKKGVNIPELKLESDILTVKDIKDLEFGIEHRVDFVAQSFVRNASDIKRVASRVKPALPRCKVIAKIESAEGIKNINNIIQACDGILIARGDMGVSLPIYQVPVFQKQIIALTNAKRKIDITATQMLESMIEHIRPTRAEVSDVANAVFDGSDYVMLSGETAAGKYPVEAVRMMRKVVETTEAFMKRKKGAAYAY